MSVSCSSWFQAQCELKTGTPLRKFTLGTSDYSDRVLKWPKVKRTAENMASSAVTITLANHDGALNDFYRLIYTVQATGTLSLGYTHPTSGDEYITLYKAPLRAVSYPDDGTCELKFKDKLYDLGTRKIGDNSSGSTVDFSNVAPSTLAWTLCSCYGGWSTVASTSNPDIHYSKWQTWAAQFSADSILVSAHYEGDKVTAALTELLKMTDSVAFEDGAGRLCFVRFAEPSSIDTVQTRGTLKSMLIDVDALSVINQQTVHWDYRVDSDSWGGSAIQTSSISVNTYSLREDTIESDTVWYVDSQSAINLAQRRVQRYQYPPRRFKVISSLRGVHREIGDTIRLVNSFYNITSASGWRAVEQEIDMAQGLCTWITDESAIGSNIAFYLDVSTLDGDHLLL